jgi:hypothetical protein
MDFSSKPPFDTIEPCGIGSMTSWPSCTSWRRAASAPRPGVSTSRSRSSATSLVVQTNAGDGGRRTSGVDAEASFEPIVSHRPAAKSVQPSDSTCISPPDGRRLSLQPGSIAADPIKADRWRLIVSRVERAWRVGSERSIPANSGFDQCRVLLAGVKCNLGQRLPSLERRCRRGPISGRTLTASAGPLSVAVASNRRRPCI